MKKAIFIRCLSVSAICVLFTTTLMGILLGDDNTTNIARVELIIISGLILGIILSWVLSKISANAILKPIRKTIQSISNLKGENYDIIKNETNYKELDTLIYSINELSRSVNATLKELSDEKEKMAFLLNNMVEGLIIVDSNLKIININNCALRLFNKDNDINGRNILNLTDNSKITSAVEQAVAKSLSASFDIHFGSEYKYYSIHITPVKSNRIVEGRDITQGAVILMTDVTVSKKAEHMRAEFFANASHELKTPITTIKGFAEILANGLVTDADKVNDFLHRITDESQRMSNLINDILKISTLEAREQAEDAEEVNVNTIAKEIAYNLTPQTKSKNIEIIVSGEPISIYANYQDIYQLMINLMENAVKYNVLNGKVFVNTEVTKSGITITVKDTGIGIPKEHQSRIFERFYRVDKGRSRTVGGTGLGLAIVKHVVALYKGQITVNSEEGQGTEIGVVFPKHQ